MCKSEASRGVNFIIHDSLWRVDFERSWGLYLTIQEMTEVNHPRRKRRRTPTSSRSHHYWTSSFPVASPHSIDETYNGCPYLAFRRKTGSLETTHDWKMEVLQQAHICACHLSRKMSVAVCRRRWNRRQVKVLSLQLLGDDAYP